MSGIVGKTRRKFTLFGDTVNMASRTETSCPPDCIQITQSTHDLAVPHLSCCELDLKDRGFVEVKGSPDPIHMYLVRSAMEAYIMERAYERGVPNSS